MIPPGGRTLIAATCGMMWLCGAALGAWPPKPEASGTEIVESLFREVERVAVADKNAARRAWAWRALRNVESPAIADLYPTGLADPFPPVRVETLNSLSWLVDEENAAGDAARRAVVAALSDPDPQVRLAAAELVSYSNATESWATLGLLAGLRDPRKAVWSACLYQLETGSEENSAELLDAAAIAIRSPSPAMQYAGLMTLASLELPHERIAAAVAPAIDSPHGDIRWNALQLHESDPATAWRKWLKSPLPCNSSFSGEGFVYDLAAIGEELPKLAQEALAADDPQAFALTFDACTAQDFDPALDAATLARWAESEDPLRRDLGAGALLAASLRVLDEAAVVAKLDKRLADFLAAPAGDPRRRRLAAELVDWVRTTNQRPRVVSLFDDGHRQVFQGEEEFTPSPTTEAAHKIAAALVKAIDDRDPWVRRSACQAITTILPAAYLATGPEVDSANELWGVLFAHAGDEHPAVRRAVALGLAWYGQAAEGDEPLPSSLTAVTSLSADADQETARLAASFYLGRTSAPGAAAALRALVKATPKSISLDTDELLPTEWETAVATLIAVDPESYSLDELLAFATGPEETHSAWIALAATAAIVKRDDAALTRFLDAVARDPGRWQADVFMSALDWADETQAAEGEPTRLSPADVRAVLAFLDRLDRDQPAQATLILTLLSEVAEYGAEALGNPFPEWVKEAGGRPGLRYAALEATIDFSEDVRPALESDDAVACLIAASLVFDEVASGPPPAWLREGSPRLKAIAQEGLRRAIQNGHVEQPGL